MQGHTICQAPNLENQLNTSQQPFSNISKESPNNAQQNGALILNYSAVVINSNRFCAGFAVYKNESRWLTACVVLVLPSW